jgi:hypothetical protein
MSPMNPMHDFYITPRIVCDKYFFIAIGIYPVALVGKR